MLRPKIEEQIGRYKNMNGYNDKRGNILRIIKIVT